MSSIRWLWKLFVDARILKSSQNQKTINFEQGAKTDNWIKVSIYFKNRRGENHKKGIEKKTSIHFRLLNVFEFSEPILQYFEVHKFNFKTAFKKRTYQLHHTITDREERNLRNVQAFSFFKLENFCKICSSVLEKLKSQNHSVKNIADHYSRNSRSDYFCHFWLVYIKIRSK